MHCFQAGDAKQANNDSFIHSVKGDEISYIVDSEYRHKTSSEIHNAAAYDQALLLSQSPPLPRASRLTNVGTLATQWLAV